ncbi:MAG: hypothetical protein AAF490_05470 [Chloroflexota bacterium]
MSTSPSQLLPQQSEISLEVKEAQQKLLALRKQISQQPNMSSFTNDGIPSSCATPLAEKVQGLPAHLGWGSQNVRRVLPQSHPQDESGGPLVVDWPRNNKPTDNESTAVSIPIFPDIALSLLKEKQVSAGRIWLLLRHLDTNGTGWLEIDEVKHQLTNKQSHTRVCGWRQMRNLLNQGEGLFWKRANGRIWLCSLPKVAQALKINRLHTDSVLLPLNIVLAKIGTLRAHLYATFHSGRTESHQDGSKNGQAPIARATIQAMTQISPRIQRLYERSANVLNQSHFCIGASFSETSFKEAAWQHGPAAFRFKDTKGLQGKAGCEYVAWQMPNSYAGPHQRQSKRQRKRINKKLVDLLNKGIVGNDQLMRNRAESTQFERQYFANGRLAHKALRYRNQKPIYCPNQQAKGFWFELTIGGGKGRK